MTALLTMGSDGQFYRQPGWLMATLEGTTTDKATWVTLLEAGQPLVMPQNSTWLFDSWIVARSQVADSGGFQLTGVAARDLLAPLVVGTAGGVVASDSSSFRVQAVADVVNNALAIQVKGNKNETVNWVARVTITEMTG